MNGDQRGGRSKKMEQQPTVVSAVHTTAVQTSHVTVVPAHFSQRKLLHTTIVSIMVLQMCDVCDVIWCDEVSCLEGELPEPQSHAQRGGSLVAAGQPMVCSSTIFRKIATLHLRAITIPGMQRLACQMNIPPY